MSIYNQDFLVMLKMNYNLIIHHLII